MSERTASSLSPSSSLAAGWAEYSMLYGNNRIGQATSDFRAYLVVVFSSLVAVVVVGCCSSAESPMWSRSLNNFCLRIETSTSICASFELSHRLAGWPKNCIRGSELQQDTKRWKNNSLAELASESFFSRNADGPSEREWPKRVVPSGRPRARQERRILFISGADNCQFIVCDARELQLLANWSQEATRAIGGGGGGCLWRCR